MHSSILALIVMVLINVWFFYIWITWSQVSSLESVTFEMKRELRWYAMQDKFIDWKEGIRDGAESADLHMSGGDFDDTVISVAEVR